CVASDHHASRFAADFDSMGSSTRRTSRSVRQNPRKRSKWWSNVVVSSWSRLSRRILNTLIDAITSSFDKSTIILYSGKHTDWRAAVCTRLDCGAGVRQFDFLAAAQKIDDFEIWRLWPVNRP